MAAVLPTMCCMSTVSESPIVCKLGIEKKSCVYIFACVGDVNGQIVNKADELNPLPRSKSPRDCRTTRRVATVPPSLIPAQPSTGLSEMNRDK